MNSRLMLFGVLFVMTMVPWGRAKPNLLNALIGQDNVFENSVVSTQNFVRNFVYFSYFNTFSVKKSWRKESNAPIAAIPIVQNFA